MNKEWIKVDGGYIKKIDITSVFFEDNKLSVSWNKHFHSWDSTPEEYEKFKKELCENIRQPIGINTNE